MDDYCDYWNPEWRKRFDGLNNIHYRVKIDGNTLYVIRQVAKKLPVYKKIFWNIYLKINNFGWNETSEETVCALVMCKMKESAVIDVLESYGFKIGGK